MGSWEYLHDNGIDWSRKGEDSLAQSLPYHVPQPGTDSPLQSSSYEYVILPWGILVLVLHESLQDAIT